MGLLADIKAIAAIQKIKNNGIAQLSIGQITGLIVNLPDAQRNLSKEDYVQVYALFKELRKCNTKSPMDMDMYLKTAIRIIQEFDKIAPYEKYSSGNELEFSFLMEDIRRKN